MPLCFFFVVRPLQLAGLCPPFNILPALRAHTQSQKTQPKTHLSLSSFAQEKDGKKFIRYYFSQSYHTACISSLIEKEKPYTHKTHKQKSKEGSFLSLL